MINGVLQMVLPVLLAVLLGYMSKKKNLIDAKGLEGIKALIGNITLPVVLFQAFALADYSKTTILSFLVVFVMLGVALTIGFFLRKFAEPYGKFMPFLVTGFEGGMLGYALFGLLYGSDSTKTFAIIDIGQTVFAYTVFLGMLKAVVGKEDSKSDGSYIKQLINPASMGMLIGIVVGITGLGGFLNSREWSKGLFTITSFIAAPTAMLVLIMVGYELSFKKELLKPVFKTAGIRLLLMAVLCAISGLILFALVPYDKPLLVALVLGFSLPAPFIIPLFADVKEHGEYISTTLSVSTLVSIITFVGIAIFSLA